MESLHNQQTLTNNDIAKVRLGNEKKEKASTVKRTACLCKLVTDYTTTGDGVALLEAVTNLYMGSD